MGEKSGIDRRVVRTKILIRDALVALIEEKGFEALYVKDITARADINRGTFYLHYKDKFELLEKTMDDIIIDFEKIFLQSKSLRLADFTSQDEPIPITQEIFEYIKENEALMHVIFGLAGGVAFHMKFRKMVENTLKLGFLGGLRAENFLVPREYLISYILHAHLGVVQSWLNTGCKESPKEMAMILSGLSMNGPIRSTGIDLNN
ncbi:MAG: TetR/AcrR family transcriptional regulator [Anaerolineaceae bacterium]|nr:TetR/AcrR family transcriptional regulator [Anaerolineaceae bacterium]